MGARHPKHALDADLQESYRAIKAKKLPLIQAFIVGGVHVLKKTVYKNSRLQDKAGQPEVYYEYVKKGLTYPLKTKTKKTQC